MLCYKDNGVDNCERFTPRRFLALPVQCSLMTTMMVVKGVGEGEGVVAGTAVREPSIINGCYAAVTRE